MSDKPGRELPKDMRAIVTRLVDEQGWRYRYGKGHPVLYPADRTQEPITLSATASDRRAWLNALARIKRAGGRI